MYSYTELVNKFNRATNPNKRQYKLENNTYVEMMTPEYFIVKLHGAQIAGVTRDKIILDSCGWRSMTTKDRLNKILDDNKTDLHIWQVNHEWRVYSVKYYDKKLFFPFHDGMMFVLRCNSKWWLLE